MVGQIFKILFIVVVTLWQWIVIFVKYLWRIIS